MRKEHREYYLYGDTPVMFVPQPDGGLLITALHLREKRFLPDTSYYGLIHFDRDGLAQKLKRDAFESKLRQLGVSTHLIEEASIASVNA